MRGKKAQNAEQIFIYIIAIVVVGFIVVYGYSAIKSFTKRGEEVEYISLKTEIENSVKGIVSDYGSVKRPEIDVPGKYERVCFVDKARGSAAQTTALCMPDGPLYEPIVCEGWKTGRSNVFLVPDGSDNFDAGLIVIENNAPFVCLEVVNNKMRLQLKGLGDKVEVSEYTD